MTFQVTVLEYVFIKMSWSPSHFYDSLICSFFHSTVAYINFIKNGLLIYFQINNIEEHGFSLEPQKNHYVITNLVNNCCS